MKRLPAWFNTAMKAQIQSRCVRRSTLVIALVLTLAVCSAAEQDPSGGEGKPAILTSSTPENLLQLHRRVLSGAGPVDEGHFADLAARGVTTIISVDGAVPQVETARRHGLKYIHLPLGYDTIDEQQAVALAKAVHVSQGVIYFHCHHGKHRSPVAASVACIGNGYLSVAQAKAVLAKAGTGKQYIGLHHAVADAKRFPQRKLDSLKATFVEVAPVSSLTSQMSEISVLADRLKASFSPNGQYDRQELSHDALMLKEHLRELTRPTMADDAAARLLSETQFRTWIQQSAKTAEQIERLWQEDSNVPPAELSKATERLLQQCDTCHQAYRN